MLLTLFSSALTQSNDRYQSVLPMQVVQHAKVRFSQHDVAWRECDKARWVLRVCVCVCV